MTHASGSGCHESNFGSCLLTLLANRSKSRVPNVFMIFSKTAVLSCHSVSSLVPLNISLLLHYCNLVCAQLKSIDCFLCTIPRFPLSVNYDLQTLGLPCDYVRDWCRVITHNLDMFENLIFIVNFNVIKYYL